MSFDNGDFCWVDLAVTDASQARQFYGSLMGWTLQDIPLGDGESYSMVMLEGRMLGGFFQMGPQLKAQGIAPHWTSYIKVENVDETAKQALAQGAVMAVEPVDVMDAGRMCLLQDPAGAGFALWQARQHPGATVWGEPGSVYWNELLVHDPGEVGAFYSRTLDWQPKPGHTSRPYTIFHNQGRPVAGMLPMDRDWNLKPQWLVYFGARDVVGLTRQAAAAGAEVLCQPVTIPQIGTFSVLSDPTGALFGLFQGV